jgi:hypothetical protein
MASIPDCTLTTACFLLTKYHKNGKTKEDCVKTMRVLLSVPCYLVIYCNPELEDEIRTMRSSYELMHITKIIVQDFEQLWCYSLLDRVKKNREISWPTRDTRTSAESHLLTCNKFDFVMQTIHSNPFQTGKFGWIDANLGENMSKISRSYQNNTLLKILNQITDKFHIQILNVCDRQLARKENFHEYYKQYQYVVCGCLFTTTPELGIRMLTRLKEIAVSTTEAGYGHAEEMLYLEILDEFYDDIYRGYGDYQDILHNFIEPTSNLVYIYHAIVMGYVHRGYDRECIDVCKRILSVMDRCQVEINYDLYVRIISEYYRALCRIDHVMADKVASTIRTYYQANPYFRNQFNNLRWLCNMQNFIL